MIKRTILQIIAILVIAGTGLAATTPYVDVVSMGGLKETAVTLPIVLTNATGIDLSAIGIDLGYDPNILENPTAAIGPAGTAADKSVVSSIPEPGVFRVGVVGLNNTVIGDGIVAYASFTIKPTATPGSTVLANAPSASDPGGNPVVVGSSNGFIRVLDQIPPLILFSPNNGEAVRSGSTFFITGGGTSGAQKYKLMYSIDNAVTWKIISSDLTGADYFYQWQVPAPLGNKKKCFVKVMGYNSNVKIAGDRSDKPFVIEVVKLTYPNGGKPPFSSGQDLTITWTTHATKKSVNKVKLSYTLDNGLTWKPFLSQPPPGSDPGSHTVQLPSVNRIKSNCKVKVVLKDGSGASVGSDVSDGAFTISP